MRALGLSLGLAWLVFLQPFPAWAAPEVPKGENQSLVLLRKAVELSRTKALYPPPDEALASAQAVRGYLNAFGDAYSTYLSREERLVLKELDRPDYAGVGMEVIQAPRKGILCVPFDAGPAHSAGIRSGDRLLAVDGESVTGSSLELLPSRVRGPVGKPVVLTVAGADGRERKIKIVRARVSRPVVESRLDGDMLKIRIYRFEKETPELVAQGLRLNPDREKIIIDLRGNIGGELKAAVDTAALLLPPGSLVASVLGRPGSEGRTVQHRTDRQDGQYAGRRIVIWQDQMTASASEVLIAALAYHGGAVTVGHRTFGKGLVQETFPTSDGGLFIITTGELLPPDGRSFNHLGLEPKFPIPIDKDLNYYTRRTAEAFKTRL